MDEPIKVKYIPVEAVKEYIKQRMWLTTDFDELVKKYGIDVVRYKNTVTIDDLEMRAVKASTDWMDVTDYVKEVVASNLEEAISKHVKCTSKQDYPHKLNPEWHNTEYRYDIMIGEIPKWQQKGEEDADKL